jgi:hypothetical protein
MAHARWLTALLLTLAAAAEARAQIYLPYGYGGSYYSRGFRIGYHRHRHHRYGFSVSAYAGGYGWYSAPVIGPYFAAPYGVTVNRINVIYQPPPTVIVAESRRDRPRSLADETAGVDLDETDPVTLKPRKADEDDRPLPRRPARPPVKKIRKPQPPPPPADDEDIDLLEAGRKAFTDRVYGLAAQRFRQAALDDPRDHLARFYLAQAQFALGKYRDAVKSIEAGMDLKKGWPAARFHARELYGKNDIDFLGHLKRLEDVLDKHPADPVLLFLRAYELWFDGKRAKARPLFRQAKKRAADPAYINQFLNSP